MTNFGYLSHLLVSVKNNHLVGTRGGVLVYDPESCRKVEIPPEGRTGLSQKEGDFKSRSSK